MLDAGHAGTAHAQECSGFSAGETLTQARLAQDLAQPSLEQGLTYRFR